VWGLDHAIDEWDEMGIGRARAQRSAAVLVIVIDARDVGRSGWRAVGISRRRGGTEVLLASGGPRKTRITRNGSALSVKDRLRQLPGPKPTGLLAPVG
jgi:hypothetical protein